MKKPLQLIFICIFFVGMNFSFSQNQAKKWYFGQGAGLDFMTNPPTVLTGMMSSWEGCASVADVNGVMQFYTDGITVWNPNQAVMANGTGLFGNPSSTQSGVIVKQPGNNSLYYIFTVDAQAGANGLRYSIVDMSLVGGTGSVTVKNVLLVTPSTEKVTGVKHCNGTDVWVVSHDCGSNNFRSYLITSTGLNPTPVLTPVGTVNNCGGSSTIGYLKASPNGRKLGVAIHGQNLFELYDFDNSTGIVSNPLILGNFTFAYGCEFSPDGTKFYGTREGFGDANVIYQWNLCAGSPAAIVASIYSITTLPGFNLYALQVATDGKIYVSRLLQPELGVINNPNVYGPGCNFVDLGQSIAPNLGTLGLPNFITSFLRVPIPFTFTTSCLNGFFSAPSSSLNTCTAASYPATGWQWNFGDPVSGPANTSTLANPTHAFSGGGTFTVQLITNYACQGLIDTVKIPITLNSSGVVVGTAPTLTQASCSGTMNAFNLNLNFTPPNPVPGYTINWAPTPNGIINNTQTAVSGSIAPGTYNATITTSGGCFITTGFVINAAPTIANFTATPPSSITCSNTQVIVSVAPNTYTYSWLSISNPSLSGTTHTFSGANSGTYTITATNGFSDCATSQVITIVQNTAVPTNSVNPTSQAITCNSGAPVTFSGTVLNPTVNIQHDWYSPLNPLPGGVPIATSNNTISILSGVMPPGVYTLVTTNLVNGCTAQKTVTITSLSAWPTFSLASPTNFSVGCNPLNCTTLSIINPVSTQTPPATCSYTFLAPSFTGVVTPSVPLGNSSSTAICTPGTWTVIVQDNSNFCRTTISVPVLQNTVAPNVGASIFTQTLTCYNPTVVATGTTSTPNSTVNWIVPSVPPFVSQPTIVIGDPVNGPATGTTSLVYANFTVVATNSLNACQSTSVVSIAQNFKKPISSPTISIATPTAIYCTAASAPVVLTTGNSTTTSGGGPTAFVANPCWSGPSPQTPTCGPSSYSCYVPGVYTLTVMDNYNGCLNSGTVNVLDKTQPPVLNTANDLAIFDCNSDKTDLIVSLNGSTSGLRYWYYGYPIGAAFSPTNASNAVGTNLFLSGTTSQTVSVSKTGSYFYVVTNTVTGCSALGGFEVGPGILAADFNADPMAGVAPLAVNFSNNSASSSNAFSITSVWSFGNGTSQTTTSNINTSALYNSPGTYTVLLVASKGTCIDSSYRIIKVEIPSKLEIPNIFTPNGDGSNDVFFLKTANMDEINAVMFDRWGNKVYETKSTSGNIAWDGKNFSGKECAAGVYLYIITGKGNDGKEYKNKGNVTLIR